MEASRLREQYGANKESGRDRVIRDVSDSVVDLTSVEDATEDLVIERPPIVQTGITSFRRHRLIGFALALIDILCLTTALLAAHALRFDSLPDWDYTIGMVVAAALWVGVFHAFGLYAPQHLPRVEEVRRTVSAVGVGIVVVILLTFWLDVYLSRSWMAYTLIIALVLELTARGIARLSVDHRQTSRSLKQRTLVIGTGERAAELMTELDVPGSGYLALGYIDAESPLISSATMSPPERVERLRTVFHGYDLDCVFVASPTIGVDQMVAVTRAARLEGIVVRIYTHLSGILASRLTVQHVGKEGVALTLKPTRLSPGQRVVKRGMDLVLASVGLVFVSPVLLVVALAIKSTSRGPVLFRQERVTEGGRTFRMYKFRTMTDATDGHTERDPIDRSAAFFKLKSDPRLTKLGTRLRRWSIDELPQLFNVILGDMSLVGPRPLPAEQVSANFELLGPRHEVRAGITGWWQINGRADLDSEEAVRMDHFYIENWSPALDAYILLRTVGALFTREGAY
jgi:exopolysaccharide biosynthesis polyprenyl glycosylphosphotransferase